LIADPRQVHRRTADVSTPVAARNIGALRHQAIHRRSPSMRVNARSVTTGTGAQPENVNGRVRIWRGVDLPEPIAPLDGHRSAASTTRLM